MGQKNVLYCILQRKNSFLGYKNNKFKKSKKRYFSKGVNPWFWSKNWPFLDFFFLGNIGQENVFYNIVEQRNAFLGFKNKKFKRSKNWHFSKGVNLWFLSKNGHFWKFFFLGNIGQENGISNILERKNSFLGYKNKTLKNWHFFEGVNPWFWSKNGHFSKFFFRQYRPGKCLLGYSRTKKRLFRF